MSPPGGRKAGPWRPKAGRGQPPLPTRLHLPPLPHPQRPQSPLPVARFPPTHSDEMRYWQKPVTDCSKPASCLSPVPGQSANRVPTQGSQGVNNFRGGEMGVCADGFCPHTASSPRPGSRGAEWPVGVGTVQELPQAEGWRGRGADLNVRSGLGSRQPARGDPGQLQGRRRRGPCPRAASRTGAASASSPSLPPLVTCVPWAAHLCLVTPSSHSPLVVCSFIHPAR